MIGNKLCSKHADRCDRFMTLNILYFLISWPVPIKQRQGRMCTYRTELSLKFVYGKCQIVYAITMSLGIWSFPPTCFIPLRKNEEIFPLERIYIFHNKNVPKPQWGHFVFLCVQKLVDPHQNKVS